MPRLATALRAFRHPVRTARAVRDLPARTRELARLRRDVTRLRAEITDLRRTHIHDTHRLERPDALARFGVRYPVDIARHELARAHVLRELATHGSLRFLDAGGRDGKLKGLIGQDLSRELFDARVTYTGMDIDAEDDGLITGDICRADLPEQYPQFVDSFDVVYSNNVFEHLRNPFAAIRNLHRFTRPGGIVIINAPFAWRYHAVPGDYFRYTHTGLVALLEENDLQDVEILDSGYDITERRRNRQGVGMRGEHVQDDICPEDEFGAWREHWQAVLVYRRTAPAQVQIVRTAG
jgi:SAM-dependent methyltransferase